MLRLMQEVAANRQTPAYSSAASIVQLAEQALRQNAGEAPPSPHDTVSISGLGRTGVTAFLERRLAMGAYALTREARSNLTVSCYRALNRLGGGIMVNYTSDPLVARDRSIVKHMVSVRLSPDFTFANTTLYTKHDYLNEPPTADLFKVPGFLRALRTDVQNVQRAVAGQPDQAQRR